MDKTKTDLYLIKNNRKSRLDLRSLLSLPTNIHWKDLDGRALACNDLVSSALGYKSPEDLVGQKSSDFMPPHLAKFIDAIDSHKQEKSLVEYQCGKYTSELSTKYPKGEVVGLFGTETKIEGGISKNNHKYKYG